MPFRTSGRPATAALSSKRWPSRSTVAAPAGDAIVDISAAPIAAATASSAASVRDELRPRPPAAGSFVVASSNRPRFAAASPTDRCVVVSFTDRFVVVSFTDRGGVVASFADRDVVVASFAARCVVVGAFTEPRFVAARSRIVSFVVASSTRYPSSFVPRRSSRRPPGPPKTALSVALLLVPDFALIAVGWLLKRYARFELAFWTGLERLVYFVLFPSLLFTSTATAKLDFDATAGVVGAAIAAVFVGVVLGYAARPLLKPSPDVFASGVQCAFRFNSYVALALAGRLGGGDGIALMAVALGVCVPIANGFAVYALARHAETGVLREMLRNPLILATVGGLIVNVAGLHLPEPIVATLQRLGNASIALGLIAVGAGLTLGGTIVERPTLAWFVAVKLVAAPAVVFALVAWLGLPPLQREIAVLFAALPSASSAYILAVRMGGNGAVVAFIISASTVLSVVTLPLWILAAR